MRSVKSAELTALIQACQLTKEQLATVYTDSSYTFGVARDFGILWQQWGFLPLRDNLPKKNGKWRLRWWLSGKESACWCRGRPWSGKIPLATGQLSPCTTMVSLGAASAEPTCHDHWSCAPKSPCPAPGKATTMRSPCTAAREWPPLSTAGEKPTQQGSPHRVINQSIMEHGLQSYWMLYNYQRVTTY